MKENNRNFNAAFVDSLGNRIDVEAGVFYAQTQTMDAIYESYKDGEISYKAYEDCVLVRSDFTEMVSTVLSGYSYCKVGNPRPMKYEYGEAVLMDSIISEGRSLIMSDPSADAIRKFRDKVLKIEKDFERFKKASQRYEEASERAERLNRRFDAAVNDANDMINRGDYEGFISLIDQVIPDHNMKMTLKVEAARASAREREIFKAAKAEKKKEEDKKVIIQEAIKEGSMYLLGAVIPIIVKGIIRKK